jgi:hypothetical protein
MRRQGRCTFIFYADAYQSGARIGRLRIKIASISGR